MFVDIVRRLGEICVCDGSLARQRDERRGYLAEVARENSGAAPAETCDFTGCADFGDGRVLRFIDNLRGDIFDAPICPIREHLQLCGHVGRCQHEFARLNF